MGPCLRVRASSKHRPHKLLSSSRSSASKSTVPHIQGRKTKDEHRMNAISNFVVALLIPSVVLLHLYWSPYTKVEESFNIQAAHDILLNGIPTKNVTAFFEENYDHFTFPGPIPRTFIGALMLAGLSRPWIAFVLHSSQLQFVARATLGLFNAMALLSFRNAVNAVFGETSGTWYTVFQASQFHVLYYASRTLPNIYAFGLTTFAMRNVLLAMQGPDGLSIKRQRLAIYLMTLAGIIFRSEVAILLACHGLSFVLAHRGIPMPLIAAGLTGVAIGLALTVSVDSFFWQRFPLWPEWTGFYFNTILGKSAEWGVSPWYTYFLAALPKLLMNPVTYGLCIPLAVGSPGLQRRTASILLPHLGFVAVYSLLPHKEWRFIIYIVPGLTAVAATGAAWIWNRRSRALVYRLLSLILVVSTLATFITSLGLLLISSYNYPGGTALERLHVLDQAHLLRTNRNITVHLDNLACQTGATRFLQDHGERPKWIYDKTEEENLLLKPDFWQRFDYVLAERPEKVIGSWEIMDTVYAYAGVGIVKPGEQLTYEREPFDKGEDVIALIKEDGLLMRLWFKFESVARMLTRGWWVRVKMEPKLRILKKQSIGKSTYL